MNFFRLIRFASRLCLHRFAAACFLFIVLLASTSASANIFYVTDSSDTTNAASLRGAIIAANALGGDNTIVLTNSLYLLTIQGADEDAGFTGDLDITNGELTIIGLANSAVVISATNLGDRVMQISQSASLSCFNLELTGGANANSEDGGCITNSGSLFLSSCIIANNVGGTSNIFGGYPGFAYGFADNGGGLYNTGTAEMDNCVISGNHCAIDTGGGGGGIYNAGFMTLNNCIIDGNSASMGNGEFFIGDFGGNAGGIYNDSAGMLYLNDCTISSNFSGAGSQGVAFNGGSISAGYVYACPGGQGGDGGGIYNEGALTINASTLNKNSTGSGGDGQYGYPDGGYGGSGGSGGAVYNSGSLTITTCTLCNNSCGNGGTSDFGLDQILPVTGANGGDGGTGGAIFNASALTILASALVNNLGGSGGNGSNAYFYFTNDGGGGIGGVGGTGGIATLNITNASTVLLDTIAAFNSPGIGGIGGEGETTNLTFIPAPSGTNGTADLSGTFISAGHNLIGQTNGASGITNRINGDLAGSAVAPINPLLGPLANYGGPTQTLMPLPGSPAIDAGDDSILNAPAKLQTDQRGLPRKSGAHVDIGAVEYNGVINGVLQPAIVSAPQYSPSGFQFTFNAATQLGYTILASTNLADWSAIGSATEISPGYFSFSETFATNYPSRFYQVRHP